MQLQQSNIVYGDIFEFDYAEHGLEQTEVDFDYSQDQSDEEEYKKQKRELRKLSCGNYAIKINPLNGSYMEYRYRCDLWRDGCERCAEFHADKLCSEIQAEFFKGKNILYLEVSKEKGDILAEQMGKESYRRLPVGNIDIFFIGDADQNANDKAKAIFYDFRETVKTLSRSDFEKLDWKAMTQTPSGRKKSGGLGTPPATINAGKPATIEEIIFHSNVTSDEIRGLYKRAIEETKHLKPKTIGQLEIAIKERNRAIMKLAGNKIKCVVKSIRNIKEEDIKW